MREEIEQEHGWSKQKGEEPQRRAKGKALFCNVFIRGLRCFDVVHVYVLIANCQLNSVYLLVIPN